MSMHLKSQQERDNKNSEIAKEHSKIAKEASQIAKEINQMWKDALRMTMACFQQWQSSQQQLLLSGNNINKNNAYQAASSIKCPCKGEEFHGEGGGMIL